MSKTVKHLLGLLLALLLVLGMLFSLKSCGDKINLPNFGEMRVNERAKAVEDLINTIPETVQLSDSDLINRARSAYDALSNSDKKVVTNLDKLVNAENLLKTLSTEVPSESENFIALKDLLGSIRDFEKPLLFEKFDEAKRAYDNLSNEEKAKIDLTDLLALETELKQDGDFLNFVLNKIELPKDLDVFNKLKLDIDALSDEEKAKIDMDLLDRLNASLEAKQEEVKEEVAEKSEAVKKVEDMIAAIKTPITLDNENELSKVLEMYNALSDAEKEDVSNYNLLRRYLDDLSDLQDEVKNKEAEKVDEQPQQVAVPNTGVE